MGAVIAKELGRRPEPGPRLRHVLRPDRRPRLRAGGVGLPRLAVLADRADDEPDPREHPPARVDPRTRPRRAGRASRVADPQVRPRSPSTALSSHNEAYQRVRGLMASDTLFDVTQEPQSVRDAYGPTQFGEQALVARRLVEARRAVRPGRPAWWDSHGQNFETHQELVPELDHVMSTLLDDLEQRGLLERHAGRDPRRVRPDPAPSTAAWGAITSPPPGAPRSPAAGSRAAPSSARPTRRG